MNYEKNSTGDRDKKPAPISGTRKIAGVAIFTAIVVLLQLLGSAIHVGPFSISLVLLPIVIGSALYGIDAGEWLGFVFGAVVLLSGDASLFLAVSIPGAILVCIIKGIVSGIGAGAMYKLGARRSDSLGVIFAAVAAPVCNTGVFLLGCLVFFMEPINEWARAAGMENVGVYMITAFVGINFLIEMGINILLAPVTVRLIKLARKVH